MNDSLLMSSQQSNLQGSAILLRKYQQAERELAVLRRASLEKDTSNQRASTQAPANSSRSEKTSPDATGQLHADALGTQAVLGEAETIAQLRKRIAQLEAQLKANASTTEKALAQQKEQLGAQFRSRVRQLHETYEEANAQLRESLANHAQFIQQLQSEYSDLQTTSKSVQRELGNVKLTLNDERAALGASQLEVQRLQHLVEVQRGTIQRLQMEVLQYIEGKARQIVVQLPAKLEPAKEKEILEELRTFLDVQNERLITKLEQTAIRLQKLEGQISVIKLQAQLTVQTRRQLEETLDAVMMSRSLSEK